MRRTLALRLTRPDLAAKAGISTYTLLNINKSKASIQLGYWLRVLWALDLLDGFDNAAAQRGRTEANLLENCDTFAYSWQAAMDMPPHTLQRPDFAWLDAL